MFVYMRERETGEDQKPTPEEYAESLRNYLKDAKPGTPKYMALSDLVEPARQVFAQLRDSPRRSHRHMTRVPPLPAGPAFEPSC